MNRIALFLMVLFSFNCYSQKINTYDNWGLEHGNVKDLSVSSIFYGQSITIGDKLFYSTGLGAKLNFLRVKTNEIPSIINGSNYLLEPTDNLNYFTINVPVHAEIGYRNLSFQANVDLLGWSINKSISSNNFNIDPALDEGTLVANPKGVNWLFQNKTRKRSLTSQFSVNYTINQSLTIKLGMAQSRYYFATTLSDETTEEVLNENRFADFKFYPFIGIRLNNEK